jgi:hypothetical protein
MSHSGTHYGRTLRIVQASVSNNINVSESTPQRLYANRPINNGLNRNNDAHKVALG